jgi:ABC-2 type transport system permease protein
MSRISFYTLTKREIHRFIKVINQTLFPPVISALIYLTVFHFVMGRNTPVEGVSYLQFLVPGLVMMAMINSAFANSSSSLFISKWTKHIEHILTFPLSYLELVSAYVIGSMGRAVITGVSIFIGTLLFVPFSLHNPFMVFIYFIVASFMFGSLGVLIALWSEHFEHIGIFNTFFLTPLTMLGGVFYSIKMLPSIFQTFTLVNPVFYFIDGFRYGILGVHDAPLWLGLTVTTTFSLGSFLLVVYLMKKGWKVKQ